MNVDEKYYPISQFIFASAGLYCIFHIVLMYHKCAFHCVLSHCTFHVSLSLLLIALESKRYYQTIQLCFCQRLTIGQSNGEAVTAENEEQDSLNNTIYIKFRSYCFFSLKSTLKAVPLKCRKLIKRYLWWSSYFRHSYGLRAFNFTKNTLL